MHKSSGELYEAADRVQDVAAPAAQTWREPNNKINAAVHNSNLETTAPSASGTAGAGVATGAGVGATSATEIEKSAMSMSLWELVKAL